MHSNGQLSTKKDGDTEKGCQKPAVQQKTTDNINTVLTFKAQPPSSDPVAFKNLFLHPHRHSQLLRSGNHDHLSSPRLRTASANLSLSVDTRLRTMTTAAIRRAKLQSHRDHQQTNIQFSTSRLPLLLPNQQCPSILSLGFNRHFPGEPGLAGVY